MKDNYSEEIEASYDAGKSYSIAYGIFIGLIGTWLQWLVVVVGFPSSSLVVVVLVVIVVIGCS
jgi:hypothetical protein